MKNKKYVHCLPDISFTKQSGVFDLAIAKAGQLKEGSISEGDVVVNFRCALCGKEDVSSLKEAMNGIECDCAWTFFLDVKGTSFYLLGD